MSLARIPFSATDEQVIRTLNGWMLFVAVIHFIAAAFVLLCGCFGILGAIGKIAASPLGGSILAVQMFMMPFLGAVMLVEGVLALQARGALGQVVDADTHDQAQLSEAFKRLKIFFMLELAWFGITVFSSLLGLVLAIVAPELAGPSGLNVGQDGAGWNMGGTP